MAETATKTFTDFQAAWEFLNSHKIFREVFIIPGRDNVDFNRFRSALYTEVVRVNPKTEKIDEDEDKNTETRIWLECGPWCHDDPMDSQGNPSHDYELDCGAPTFEEAIVKLANLVLQKYGE